MALERRLLAFRRSHLCCSILVWLFGSRSLILIMGLECRGEEEEQDLLHIFWGGRQSASCVFACPLTNLTISFDSSCFEATSSFYLTKLVFLFHVGCSGQGREEILPTLFSIPYWTIIKLSRPAIDPWKFSFMVNYKKLINSSKKGRVHKRLLLIPKLLKAKKTSITSMLLEPKRRGKAYFPSFLKITFFKKKTFYAR